MGTAPRRDADFTNENGGKTPPHNLPLSKVDPRGPAIPNLLHPYLLLSGTDRAQVKNTENGHKTGRQGTDFDENL